MKGKQEQDNVFDVSVNIFPLTRSTAPRPPKKLKISVDDGKFAVPVGRNANGEVDNEKFKNYLQTQEVKSFKGSSLLKFLVLIFMLS